MDQKYELGKKQFLKDHCCEENHLIEQHLATGLLIKRNLLNVPEKIVNKSFKLTDTLYG